LNGFSDFRARFLTFYDFSGKTVQKKTFSRGEFFELSMRALSVICSENLKKGDRHVHFVSGNSVEDLAFRMGSMFIGTIPVTVNWYVDIELEN